MPRPQEPCSSVLNPAAAVHELPSPKPRRNGTRSATGRTLDHRAFAKIRNPAADALANAAVEEGTQKLLRRFDELQSGTGGPLFTVPPELAVPMVWVDGYLGLIVDEEHGEVRRRGTNVTVSFDVGSLPWQVFVMAWESGETGCGAEDWMQHKSDTQSEVDHKYHRREVNDKIAVLGLRLEHRRPPRLVEIVRAPR